MKTYVIFLCLFLISAKPFAQNFNIIIKDSRFSNLISHLSYIPSKSFESFSCTGGDSVSFYKSRIVSNVGFYISKYEVSNKEYRDFVIYIRDSIAHTLLKHFKKGSGYLNWNLSINWKDPLLEPIMLLPDDRIFGKTEIDINRIKYEIAFFGTKETIPVYPDSLTWLSDFVYSYNEPLVKNYFNHKAFDKYPVVGVNLKQAMAFCQWKTAQINNTLKQAESAYKVLVRLPTIMEWESAATSNNDKEKIYSPIKPYSSNFGTITDKNGNMVKDYKDDGYYYTSPVIAYRAGIFGLYNMKGNIAEWTSEAAGNIQGHEKIKDLFVVKGGGWNSQPVDLQTGACQFFASSAAHSFVGFRYIVIVKK